MFPILNYFCNKIVSIDVGISDIVHDVETVFRMCCLLTAYETSIWNTCVIGSVCSSRASLILQTEFEPRREKTGFLHMPKQRRRSASR